MRGSSTVREELKHKDGFKEGSEHGDDMLFILFLISEESEFLEGLDIGIGEVDVISDVDISVGH